MFEVLTASGDELSNIFFLLALLHTGSLRQEGGQTRALSVLEISSASTLDFPLNDDVVLNLADDSGRILPNEEDLVRMNMPG